jgi:hypothetical protein
MRMRLNTDLLRSTWFSRMTLANTWRGSVPNPYDIFSVDLEPLIHASDYWIRILLFSSLTFKKPTKNEFLKISFSAYSFLKEQLHHFSQIKSPKEVTKQ